MAAPAITPQRVLSIARAYIGTTEDPPNSNRTRFGEAFGWDGVNWCGIFVWAVFRDAGIDLRARGLPGREAASTNFWHERIGAAGWTRVPSGREEPGDVVIYDFGVVAAGDTPDDADHIGIVSASLRTGIKAIEGNTSPGAGGSQANGGGVYERTRDRSLIKSVWRPPYEAWARELGDPMADLTSEHLEKIATAVWSSSAAEFYDEDGDGRRDVRTPKDILFATHRAALRAQEAAAAAASAAQVAAAAARTAAEARTPAALTTAAAEAAAAAGAARALAELGQRLTDGRP